MVTPAVSPCTRSRQPHRSTRVLYHATTLANLSTFELGIGGAGESDNPLQCIWLYDSPDPARRFARMTLGNRRQGASLWVYQVRLRDDAVVADMLSPQDLAAVHIAALREGCIPWWRRWVCGRTWPEALGFDLDRRGIHGYQDRKNAMFARLRDAGVHALRNCEVTWVAGTMEHVPDDYGATTTVLLDPAVAAIRGFERL